MNIILAEILSFLFHPVLFFLGAPFFIVYKTTHNGFYAFKWGFFTSIFIFIAIFILLWGRKIRLFSDIDLSNSKERAKFYFVSVLLAVIYFTTAIFFKGLSFPLSIIGFGILLGTLVFAVINYRIKASIHAASSFAFAVSLGILYGPMAFLISLSAALLVVWARIFLKRHTYSEVLIGAVLGIIITLITFLVGQNLYRG